MWHICTLIDNLFLDMFKDLPILTNIIKHLRKWFSLKLNDCILFRGNICGRIPQASFYYMYIAGSLLQIVFMPNQIKSSWILAMNNVHLVLTNSIYSVNRGILILFQYDMIIFFELLMYIKHTDMNLIFQKWNWIFKSIKVDYKLEVRLGAYYYYIRCLSDFNQPSSI